MIRRKFLGLATLAGAGSLAALSAVDAAHRQTARFAIDGFTCITCAVGLETLLLRQKGILQAAATYPEGTASVTYDTRSVTPEDILSAVASMGFRARQL